MFLHCTFDHNSCNAIDTGGGALEIDGSVVSVGYSEMLANRVSYAGSAAIHANDSTLLLMACGISDSVFDTPVVNRGEAVSVSGGRLSLTATYIVDNYRDAEETQPVGLWLDQVGEFLVSSSSITGVMGTIDGSSRINGPLGNVLRIAAQRGQRVLSFGAHSEIRGCGLVIEPDVELHLDDYATMRQQHRGWVGADGRLVVTDEATLEDTYVAIAFSFFPEGVFDEEDPADVIDCMPDTQISVTSEASVRNNYIYTVDDRYMDFDVPGAATGIIDGNRIFVSMPARLNDPHGLLLEARGIDMDCPDPPNCPSGTFALSSVPPATEESWTLERLVVSANSRVNIVNRFDYQDPLMTGGLPEVVYARELWIGPNAVLNTGLNRLYYESLLDDAGQPLDPPDADGYLTNGARFVDVPLQGFSLINIDMESDCEYLLRVETDESGGSVTKLDDVMLMDAGGTGHAEAYAAFGKANAEERVDVVFRYQFQQPMTLGQTLEVYVSGQPLPAWGPTRPPEYITIATIPAPPNGRPGAYDSSKYAVFTVTANVDTSAFTRGLYVGLRLEGAGTSILIDDWDPYVDCIGYCGDVNGTATVDDEDYVVTLALHGAALDPGVDWPRLCVDLSMAEDFYIDDVDLEFRDCMLHEPALNDCGVAHSTKSPVKEDGERLSPLDLPTQPALLVAGKQMQWGNLDDRLIALTRTGDCYTDGTWPQWPASPEGDYGHFGNGRLVRDADGVTSQVHGLEGLYRLDTGQCLIAPGSSSLGDGTILVGVDLGTYPLEGVPLLDVACDRLDPSYAYVAPVSVFDGLGNETRGAAQLMLSGNGNWSVVAAYHVPVGAPERSDPTFNGNAVREVEVDHLGNVFLLHAHALNDNCRLLVFDNAGAESASFELDAFVASPANLLVSEYDPDRLYMTSNAPNPDQTSALLHRFTVQRSGNDVVGLTYDGATTIDLPDNQHIEATQQSTIVGLTEEVVTGTLYALGMTRALTIGENEYVQAGVTALDFVTPSVAVIPWDSGPGPVTAQTIDCHSIGLPVSIVLVNEPPAPGRSCSASAGRT